MSSRVPRGIPEVPLNIDPQHRRFLVDLREMVVQLRENQSPPTVPTNFTVTAQGFQNLLQWTRSINADFFEVLWSSSPLLSSAVVVPVGNAQSWVDSIGQVNIKRYYWVRAAKNTGPRSVEVGPVIATTLASGTGVTPPRPPVPSQTVVQDQRTGYHTYKNVY
jgi:hypothetical protein